MVTPLRRNGQQGYQTNIGFVGENHSGFEKTLSSKQFSTLIDVLSEGEIEGSATASQAGITNRSSNQYRSAFLKDVFLDGTQIYQQNAPNSGGDPVEHLLNYKNVGFDVNFGLNNQDFLPGISSIETEVPVGVTVEQNNPVTRTVTNTEVDAVRVTLGFPRFLEVDPEVGIVGTLVDIDIKLIQGNGTITQPIVDTVIGKSNDAYFRDYIINFPSDVVFPVQVRVGRNKADSGDTDVVDAFQFTSLTEIIYEKRRYEDIAHTKLRFDSSISPNIPSRMFRIRGVRIKIPHNATVNLSDGSLEYSGVFNGTLQTDKKWCSDPAWILYDLLTNTRYGAGIDEASLDKFSFYSASVYCNEKINNGFGGLEPRFSCNININNSYEAFDLINNLCTTMNVMPFYSGGSIVISQDRPSDPSYQFTLANVLEGGFEYSGSSQKTRHTIFNVAYFNTETRTVDLETVKDTDANIAKLGSIVKNVTAFACTSRGQAKRLGKWFLYNEQNATETCTFTATAEAGVLIRPGQIIQISDPVRAGVRRGGLVASATTTEITVDDSTNTDLDATNTAKLSVILPDGTLETKNVDSISGAVITVTDAFSQTPQTNTVWVLENDIIQPTTWRITNIVEDGLNYTVTALTHNSSKYGFIEDGSQLEERQITILNELKEPPSNLSGTEEIIAVNNRAFSKITFTWQPVKGVNQYRVAYRFKNGNEISTDVRRNDFEIFNSQIGIYEVRVSSLNAIGEPSTNASTISFNAIGKTALPGNVQNLRIEPINTKLIRLRWDQSVDTDVIHGGFCRIRHSPKTDGSGTFQNATDIDKLAGNSTQITLPYIEGEYLVRFEDDGGRLSASSASIIIDLPDPLGDLTAQTRREDNDSPKFQGTKTNVTFDSSVNSLKLTDPATNATGEYAFNEVLDLGGVFSLDLKRHVQTEGFYSGTLFDSRSALIDTWTDFDGAQATAVNCELFVAVTQDNPSSGSPTFTAFQTFVNGAYKGRGFKFKAVLTSGDPAQNIKVSELGYTATFQRRTEQSATAIASGSGVKNITFSSPFFTGTSALLGANSNLPSIGITATDNITSGDYFQVTNISATGFSVHFKDSSNASISRNFNFTAVGFGKGV
tara:strand:+ start:697 stop:4029 length:3333 start_codon:yes stop_codon:yes gene_type:complete